VKTPQSSLHLEEVKKKRKCNSQNMSIKINRKEKRVITKLKKKILDLVKEY
jgi:hypothetical protein